MSKKGKNKKGLGGYWTTIGMKGRGNKKDKGGLNALEEEPPKAAEAKPEKETRIQEVAEDQEEYWVDTTSWEDIA